MRANIKSRIIPDTMIKPLNSFLVLNRQSEQQWNSFLGHTSYSVAIVSLSCLSFGVMFMRNKLVWNVASCQISIWTRHMERKLTQASRTCRGRRKGVSEEPHHSLQRQLPSTPCSPSRLVLAKTSVFTEKNTAKKLTLGDWRQHSVIFTFLWSYFQVLKSIKKIPHTQQWLEIFFFFCSLGADLRLRWTENDMSASLLSVPMFSTLFHSHSGIMQPSRLTILNVSTQASFLICPSIR